MFVTDSEGLQVGAPVTLDGMPAGNVRKIELAAGSSAGSARRVELVLRIDKRLQVLILSDSTASLLTQGLLGKPYVAIHRGFSGQPIPPGREIRALPVKQLTTPDLMTVISKITNCQADKNGSTPQKPPSTAQK